ncbi:MAG: hydroxyisourate hydrolase [Burkholderiaceae bacterium]|nr:hydroxyisourate hydrolase [Burkholderiaceae bacterium]
MDGQPIKLLEARTNRDGRCDAPLLAGGEFRPGRFISWFFFFMSAIISRLQGLPVADPPFIDQVPLAFRVSGAQACHMPLLVSPWSYSTYRGS